MPSKSTQPRADGTQQFAEKTYKAPEQSVFLVPEGDQESRPVDKWAGPNGRRIELLAATCNAVSIEVEDRGDGLNGPYNDQDEDDIPCLHLRVVHVDIANEGERDGIQSAFSHTQIPVNVDEDKLFNWLMRSATELDDNAGDSILDLGPEARDFAWKASEITAADLEA